MSNTALPRNTNTIEYLMENISYPTSETRGYLGMSGIGGKCARAMYYGFHFASIPKPIPPRTRRIFSRGDLEEARIIEDLKLCGCEVFRLDAHGNEVEHFGLVNEEQEQLVGFAGHAKGHPDGRVRGLPECSKVHLLEIKTAKAAKFKVFQRSGVRVANPTYYGQTQRYMDKMNLDRTLFICTNKDTEERYYERIRLDKVYARELARREAMIITSTEPPVKLSHNKNWIDCKWCNHADVCHEGIQVRANCRTCDHSDIEDNGVWSCSVHETELSIEDQLAGCVRYRQGWGF